MIGILLAIAVWAFCRAYYFAFYVIEKYIDPRFRFDGLISVARYFVMGPDRYLQATGEIPVTVDAVELTESYRWGPFYWLVIKWSMFAFLANALIPRAYSDFSAGRQLELLAVPIWVAILAAEVAICAILGSWLSAPMKYRLPISFIAVLVLAIAIATWSSESAYLDCAILAYTIGFLILTACARIFQWRLGIANQSQDNPIKPAPSAQNQISIRYIYVATTVTAMAIAVLKVNAVEPFQFFADPYFHNVVIPGIGMELALALISICAIHFVLASNSAVRRWHATLLVVGLAVFPYSSVLALDAASIRRATAEDYVSMHIFFVGYAALILVLLFFARETGLRLIASPDRPEHKGRV